MREGPDSDAWPHLPILMLTGPKVTGQVRGRVWPPQALGGTQRLYSRNLSSAASAAASPWCPSLAQDPASPGPILTLRHHTAMQGACVLLLLGLRLQLSLGLVPGNQAAPGALLTGAAPG